MIKPGISMIIAMGAISSDSSSRYSQSDKFLLKLQDFGINPSKYIEILSVDELVKLQLRKKKE